MLSYLAILLTMLTSDDARPNRRWVVYSQDRSSSRRGHCLCRSAEVKWTGQTNTAALFISCFHLRNVRILRNLCFILSFCFLFAHSVKITSYRLGYVRVNDSWSAQKSRLEARRWLLSMTLKPLSRKVCSLSGSMAAFEQLTSTCCVWMGGDIFVHSDHTSRKADLRSETLEKAPERRSSTYRNRMRPSLLFRWHAS